VAARCRLLHFENSARGGLRIKVRIDEVSEEARASTQPLERQRLWGNWYRNGIVRNIAAAEDVVARAGLSVAALKEKARGPVDSEEPAAKSNKRMKKRFQRTVTKELGKCITINKVARMRFKLERWALGGRPGDTASCFLRALGVVKRYLPPKVASSVLRVAWNGWCTRRRFQGRGPCRFNCGSFTQEDSIEHYSGCKICVAFLRKHLYYLGPVTKGHLIVFGSNVGMGCDEDLIRLALWAFTLYKAFNHLRCRVGSGLSSEELEGLMKMFLREGVAGCSDAAQFLEHCWDPSYRLRPVQEPSSDSSCGLGELP